MEIAVDMGVPFLGAIPMDPDVAIACDSGAAFLQDYATTRTAKIVWEIARQIFSATDFGESLERSSVHRRTPSRSAVDEGEMSYPTAAVVEITDGQ